MSVNTLTVKNDAELTMAERFTNKVLAEFQASVGSEIAITKFQKRLAQNYFMVADSTLKKAELARLKKTGKYRDPLPVTWANVNMEKMAQSVVAAARIGWDPMQPNHVNLIPYKDNATQTYTMTLMPGYRGIELKAMKYGLDIPGNVIVELVYSTDTFKSHKKSLKNEFESYDFEILNDFNRGEIIGGFYYHMFKDNPEKNKLVVMPMSDILRRKPEKAAAEFWGGEKDVWENGVKTGKETVEGWFDKMCLKTIHRAAYNDITIDSQKIDDDYMKLKQIEAEFEEAEPEQIISENANTNLVDITPEHEGDQPDQAPKKEPEQVTEAEIVTSATKTTTPAPSTTEEDPGY